MLYKQRLPQVLGVCCHWFPLVYQLLLSRDDTSVSGHLVSGACLVHSHGIARRGAQEVVAWSMAFFWAVHEVLIPWFILVLSPGLLAPWATLSGRDWWQCGPQAGSRGEELARWFASWTAEEIYVIYMYCQYCDECISARTSCLVVPNGHSGGLRVGGMWLQSALPWRHDLVISLTIFKGTATSFLSWMWTRDALRTGTRFIPRPTHSIW